MHESAFKTTCYVWELYIAVCLKVCIVSYIKMPTNKYMYNCILKYIKMHINVYTRINNICFRPLSSFSNFAQWTKLFVCCFGPIFLLLTEPKEKLRACCWLLTTKSGMDSFRGRKRAKRTNMIIKNWPIF